MRPERNSRIVLSTTRSTAKMHEFRVAQADFIEGRDPTPLFSLAVGILGDVAASIARSPLGPGEALVAPDVRPAAWDHDLPVAEALRFVSNFFDAFLNAKLDDELTPEFSLLCACAYYLGGNVGSAVVIVRQMNVPALDLAGGLGRLVHRILRGDHSPIDGAYDLRASGEPILAALDRFFALEGEAVEIVERCSDLRKAGYGSGNPRLLLYADLVAALCRRKIENASRTLLPPASDLQLEAWRPALARPGFPTELWPAQQRIAGAGLLRGRSAVIQMPTSAGKTRATELIIRAAFLSGRASLAVIVAPYRSLCHDIRGDLAAAFADDAIAIDEASDAFQFDLELDQLITRDTVLIVTPEKLLYMLRRAPELADTIGLIIYDEGHQFDGMARGPTYELLLTSLRMKLTPGTQSVLISAVIGNAADIAEWLIGDRDAVIGGAGLLPTAKSIAFASWQDARGRLEYVSPTDPNEREYFVPRIITATPLAKKARERSVRVFPEKDSGDIGLFLGLHLVGNGSVAIFCGRKDSVTKLARRVIDIYERGLGVPRPIDVSDQEEVGKLAFLAGLHLGEGAATQATRMGVLSHHAATPHGLRLAIEHAMKRGHARFVVCTSTLAQGVNFPIRYLVITTTQQGAESIMVRDFHNLMGRAGRAGMHTEGSVIFSSPAIFDERGPQKDGWKWQAAKRLLDADNSEPSLSGLLKLFKPFEQRGAAPVVQPMLAQWLDLAFADQARIDGIVAEALAIQPLISAAQFRPFVEDRAHAIQQIAAFLAANMEFEDPAADDRVQELATHTLGYFLADDPVRLALIETFRMIAASIRAHADDDLQGIIRRSPLPPSVAAELQAWVAANLDNMNRANLDGTLLDVVGAAVFPHASDRSIRSMSDRTALPRLLAAWADGRNYEQLLQILEENQALRISGRKPTVEDAVSLGDGGFGYDVAMLVAAVTDLVEPVDGNLHTALGHLQKRVKYGLALPSAIAMYEAGFADRVVARALGTIWPLAIDRAGVRAVCRAPNGGMAAALQAYPEYFATVAEELRR